jgi:hypothetical protein
MGEESSKSIERAGGVDERAVLKESAESETSEESESGVELDNARKGRSAGISGKETLGGEPV